MIHHSFDLSEPSTDFSEKASYQKRDPQLTIACANSEQDLEECRSRCQNPMPSSSSGVTPRATFFDRLSHLWSREFWSIGLATGSIHLILFNLDFSWKLGTMVEMLFFGRKFKLINEPVKVDTHTRVPQYKRLELTNLCFVPDFCILWGTSVNFGMFCMGFAVFLGHLIGSPSLTWKALNDPHKGLCIPLMVTQMATLILACYTYSVPGGWLGERGALLLFYIYIAVSVTLSLFSWTIWFRKSHETKQITPALSILSFPLLLIGVIAVHLLSIIPLKSPIALDIMMIAYLFQGMSSIMAGAYLLIYLQRLAATGHISGVHASSIFLAVGPPGFTAHVLIRLGRLAPAIFVESPNLFLTETLGEACQGFGMLAGLMLTGVSVLIYSKSVIAFWWKGTENLPDDALALWIIIQLFLSGVLVSTYTVLVPLTLSGLVRLRRSKRGQSDVLARARSSLASSSGSATPPLQTFPSRMAISSKIEAHQMDMFRSPSLSRSNSIGAETLVEHAI
ncbi:hypothetical protein CROQUDRAFT_131285 [Cronartium quercuum f. sp. fusiforme G11]|uniref:Uncharacterized protein n=1 Tax=Cronartium quercuum f. sp. fusiforme G11 TaxID=708437 RepID=A0A9P6TEB5_9BASI|nr:hypothetical protein CROQUDRAFT_131285 [Cronartium quercuum f. sp. fusiforme G11]